MSIALNRDILPREGTVLAALSGGADSVCLTQLLREAGYPVAAAHFNHRLRGEESDEDERFVRALCRDWSIPLFVGSGEVAAYAESHRLGIEEAARTLRYAFLEQTAQEIGAACIATAHHAEDNAETLLLHLARGAGANGLSGIPPVRGKLVRPLLAVSRAELLQYLQERGIPHREDSTNALDTCNRNKLRHRVLPVLRELNPQFAVHTAATCASLREDEEFLCSLAEEFLKTQAADSLSVSALSALPRPVAKRVLRRRAGENRLSAGHLEALLTLCSETNGSAGLDLPGLRAVRRYDALSFEWPEDSATEASLAPAAVSPGETLRLLPGNLRLCCRETEMPAQIHSSFNTFFFKSDSICGKMTVRPRAAGDRIRFSGSSCTKSLKKLFSDAKIPLDRRGLIPILCDDAGVIAVYGFGMAQRCMAKPGERAILIEIQEEIP